MSYWRYSNVGMNCGNASEEQIVRLMDCLGFKRVKKGEFPYCEADVMSFYATENDGNVWFWGENSEFTFDTDVDGENSSYYGRGLRTLYAIVELFFRNTVMYYQYEVGHSGVDFCARIEEKLYRAENGSMVIESDVSNDCGEDGTHISVHFKEDVGESKIDLDCLNLIKKVAEQKGYQDIIDMAPKEKMDGILFSGDMKTLIAASKSFKGKCIIPEGVTSIGREAFRDCKSLTSVTIPESVTSIGEGAFDGCSSLTSITIPESVTSIGEYTFDGCSSLTSITIPESVTSIGESAFDGCSSLTSITIPESVTSIGEYTFDGCSSLISITIPESVTSIGEYTFDGCSSLISITIPESVTSIGEYTFYGCSSLTSITIPESVTSIGESAFDGCSSLTSITIPECVTSIGSAAFEGTKWLEEYLEEYPDDLVIIGHVLYMYKGNAETVVIPEGVTSIGNCAFGDCSSLTSITIPEGVTSIGCCTFFGCSSLTSITIPESVTSIGDRAFSYCSCLTELTLNNMGGLKVNVKEIIDAKKDVNEALDMLFKKDFSRKLSHKVKLKLIMDYFFATGDEDAKAYLKKNFIKVMKQTIENGDLERINKLLKKTNFVTKRNIDKFIECAVENNQEEIKQLLENFKSEIA